MALKFVHDVVEDLHDLLMQVLSVSVISEVVRMKMFRYVINTPPAKLFVAFCDIRTREILSFVCWHFIF